MVKREEVLSIASCLDGVCSQLHKHLDTLQLYSKQGSDGTGDTCKALEPKIVDMYDVCSYVHVNRKRISLTQGDTLLQRATNLCGLHSEAVASQQLHIWLQTTLHVHTITRA